MTQSTAFAAQVLSSGANGYAALAASALLERRPELRSADDGQAGASWRAHIAQRVLELQTAVEHGRPHLFVERVRWSRRAYNARGVAEDELRDAMECLRAVLAEEFPPAGREAVLSTVDAALRDFDQSLELDGRELDPESDPGRRALLYLLSVLEGRSREAVEGLLVACRDGSLSLRSCVLDILVPAQREIGRLWHLGDSDVAEEHLVTSTTKRALSALAHVGPIAAPRGIKLLTAAVEGDTHDIGGQALGTLMEAEGWTGIDLGANVPVDDLVAARVAFEPDVVVVSATLTNHLTTLERSVRAVRANAGADVRIIVGGAAVAQDPDLPLSWGADAVVDSVATAVAQLEAWHPGAGGSGPVS